ncbi:polysaccharide export outer membrane protein [Geofilum rubicundum JCM 15548]|uniref:Polysaccharide export outer membrane protein n=2 Tax=Geofilum TaxID=1236988 RepID=A0A0E9M3H1_9BACT|nr:polysaccharide export outer membrane protein [Geofilum rubicundum JCM 15548]
MAYLQHAGTDIASFDEAHLEDYLLKPNDDLFIQISSLDDVSSNVFSGTNAQQSMQMGVMQAYGASLVAYTIDKDGFLHLPVVGMLFVQGKSLTQVSLLIEESLKNVLSQPVVTVKLVNRYVSVLGEVRSPGHFTYAKEKMTIFDVLSLAGDVTVYGNRKQVILTRNEGGENSRICLDLTKSDILSSNYYYIRPNDIVYVQPLQKRFWGLREFPYTVILSSITTALLIYNVVNQ